MAKNETKSIKLEIIELKESLTSRISAGDYITLSRLLKCQQETARKRFHRYNEKAVLKMELIIQNREQFIKDNS